MRKVDGAVSMRVFHDRAGRRWEVVLGRESWGALLALFVPAGAGAVRQAPLHFDDYLDTQLRLDAMSDAELQELLDRSDIKDG